MSSRRLPPVWLFAGMGVVVVALFSWLTYQNWTNDLALADRGVETTARVTDVGSKGRVRVEFTTADGRQVSTLVGQGDEADGTRAGDTIPIAYDPQNPTSEVRDTRVPENHRLAWFTTGITLFALVSVPIATWHLAREHRRRSGVLRP
ncbi:DUF3592 domain-containing protein [Actinoplanes sp. NPDC023936]|uniref:DUF3592 domain-containing protein n=1 Tax=Actinoplanes sp. NPDC023936 TaxID=3154910 RepID=UPI0033EF998F